MNHTFKMLINGELTGADKTFPVFNPSTGDVITEVPDISENQVIEALGFANDGFKQWSSTPLAKRAELILDYATLLEENAEDIIAILIEETGKPRDNAEYDFGMLTNCLRFFVEEAKRIEQPVIVDPDERFHHFIQRQSLGVVVGYLAWNFPLLNLGYKLAPSLASGCSCIIKPSQVTPLATLKCAELAHQVGFPAGVINIITSNNYDNTNPLLTSDTTALFTMIGSTRAGVNAMKTACTSVKHFSVELGGNAPVVVYDDADLDKAVTDIVNLKYGNSGQVCVSPNRCFVHESRVAEFINKAVAHASGIQLGTGDDAERLMGPLSSEKERGRILKLIEDAVNDGAEIVLGGGVPSDRTSGFYMEPTILTNVKEKMEVARTEVFGPVLSIIPFSETDDIIAKANDTEFGLAAYVYTTNLSRAFSAAKGIQAGSVCINEAHYSVQLPHGGLKQSGVGKDCSKYSLQEFYTTKRVSILMS
ncbi:NAD-dependent succinate-semialdehyde dehydrogenase [Alteromonas sp. KC3]|uniref:aldehyde dehydrogenase family protein n=1 Tax=unclassified Alteromonas TaxID=2614992 RepID=UPI0019218D41|nr:MULTISPECIES: aldehyde dehydrogenase family protein [unclassified Alteromonas]BCO19669.1 NAD-dependent succinate-semialdehyde dehydrogenase [Alteromonas sp. KC3]BCO23634.1 NAD-dependent succinate-semialdehyde dehydrogenase [Alteromonas sp. KC14]